jgi:hypothetical protein
VCVEEAELVEEATPLSVVRLIKIKNYWDMVSDVNSLKSGCRGRDERSFIVGAGGVRVNRRQRHGCGGKKRQRMMQKSRIEK